MTDMVSARVALCHLGDMCHGQNMVDIPNDFSMGTL